MADKQQLDLLKKGIIPWNSWKKKHASLDVTLSKVNLCGINLRGVDLSGVDLSQADLRGADLSQANLRHANLNEAHLGEAYLLEADLYKATCRKTDLHEANLSKADLRSADLRHANLSETNLSLATLRQAIFVRANLSHAYLRGAVLRRANLSEASLRRANLSEADLSGANLSSADLVGAILREATVRDADLRRANLSEADLTGADLTGSAIYALSAWGVRLKKTLQEDLLITRVGEPAIMVDTLKMAQFISLLLEHEDLRSVLPVLVTTFVVLAGCFTSERLALLEPLKEELRLQGYIPVVLNAKKASNRALTETMGILAQISRYFIADLTEAPHLLDALREIKLTQSISIQPLLSSSAQKTAMLMEEVRDCNWLLPLYQYDTQSVWSDLLHEQVLPAQKQEAFYATLP